MLLAVPLAVPALSLAQESGTQVVQGPPEPDKHGNVMYMTHDGPGMHMGMHGRWWKNADLVQQVGISDAQIQQMEKIFQDNRMKLIDLHASLEKQEAVLEPLTDADNPDEAQVTAQIDKVAAARGELEKAHAHMMFDIRRVLTPEQWKKLQTYNSQHPFGGHHGMHFEMPAPPPPPGFGD